MDEEKELPQRKTNRLKNFDYSSCGVYFITICTKKRKNYFWSSTEAVIGQPHDVALSSEGKVADEAIHTISSIYPSVSVEHYVIMPDHIHLLLYFRSEKEAPAIIPNVSRVVKQLKGYVTKRIGMSLWQKSFFDHVIRNRADYDEHIKYIFENPAQWYYDGIEASNHP